MMEPIFGAGAPMWTSAGPIGFAAQTPVSVGNGPVAPAFSSPGISGLATGAPGTVQPLPVSGPAATVPFVYGSGAITASPQYTGLTYPAPLPFVRAVSGFIGQEPLLGLTAPALLATVAMRRGQPQGPNNDQEVEEFIYDALELLPGASDVEVRCEGGRVTLTGSVQQKRVKRDIGEIAWAIPVLHDVQNNLTIASRRRARTAAREGEASASLGRKQT